MEELRKAWKRSKGVYGKSDKGSKHSYVEYYEGLLGGYRGRPVRLLEIGVKDGGSLGMWAYYFRSGSVIHGIDLCLPGGGKEFPPGVEFYVGDAYCEGMVRRLHFGYDIVIDDGSHVLEDMIFVLRNYLPLVRAGGILVIEDLKKVSWGDRLREVVPEGELVDRRWVKGRKDDILFVVRR